MTSSIRNRSLCVAFQSSGNSCWTLPRRPPVISSQKQGSDISQGKSVPGRSSSNFSRSQEENIPQRERTLPPKTKPFTSSSKIHKTKQKRATSKIVRYKMQAVRRFLWVGKNLYSIVLLLCIYVPGLLRASSNTGSSREGIRMYKMNYEGVIMNIGLNFNVRFKPSEFVISVSRRREIGVRTHILGA